MSIYSGFATRQLQQKYDMYTYSLIYNLQKRLLKFLRNEPSDDNLFQSTIRKLSQAMHKMEKYKYLEPKMSQSFQELVDLITVERSHTKELNENMITEMTKNQGGLGGSVVSSTHQLAGVDSATMKIEVYEKLSKVRPMTNKLSAERLSPLYTDDRRIAQGPKHLSKMQTPQSKFQSLTHQKLPKQSNYQSPNDRKFVNSPPPILQRPLRFYKASRNVRMNTLSTRKNRTINIH